MQTDEGISQERGSSFGVKKKKEGWGTTSKYTEIFFFMACNPGHMKTVFADCNS